MNLEILQKLIEFNTESSESNLPLIRYCQIIFKKAGYLTMIWGKGERANLFAYKPTYGGRVILSAHTDTVPPGNGWKSDPYKLIKQGDMLSGLGISDMKTFIAIMLELSTISDTSNLAFLLTYNEETDFEGALQVTRKVMGKSDYLIIGEPTENKIITNSKGLVVYDLKLTGIGGHGSEPDKGVSSILAAATFITRLEAEFTQLAVQFQDKSFKNPAPTLNIGLIKGGEAPNIIPEVTNISFEVRTTSKELEKGFEVLLNKLLGSLNCKFVLLKKLSLTPFIASDKIKNKLSEFKSDKGPSYCTEANILSQLCPNTIIFGPGSIDQAHKPDESISINEVIKYNELLTEVISVL